MEFKDIALLMKELGWASKYTRTKTTFFFEEDRLIVETNGNWQHLNRLKGRKDVPFVASGDSFDDLLPYIRNLEDEN